MKALTTNQQNVLNAIDAAQRDNKGTAATAAEVAVKLNGKKPHSDMIKALVNAGKIEVVQFGKLRAFKVVEQKAKKPGRKPGIKLARTSVTFPDNAEARQAVLDFCAKLREEANEAA